MSVNLWLTLNLVWFHLWALLLYYFTDNQRNHYVKQKRDQQNQTRCCWRMEKIDIIIVFKFIIIHILANLY